jgi:DegV family protein with EDD domain
MYSIVADSCCDMSPELRKQLGVVSVPLTMTLGSDIYCDDDLLDLSAFMEAMKNCKARIGSAAPSPDIYREAFEKNNPSFGIALSSRLSASYQNARIGKTLAEEAGAQTYVFDSKSASAGEILVAIELRKLIEQGCEKSGIISKIEQFIAQMKTYFVLDNIDTLLKSGRLNFIVGKIISILGLKPLLGSDGDGNISLFSHARGAEKVLCTMADTVAGSGLDTHGRNMVITHCNNPTMARRLKDMIKASYHFAKIWVFPMRGVSSVYASDKGVIMAF